MTPARKNPPAASNSACFAPVDIGAILGRGFRTRRMSPRERQALARLTEIAAQRAANPLVRRVQTNDRRARRRVGGARPATSAGRVGDLGVDREFLVEARE